VRPCLMSQKKLLTFEGNCIKFSLELLFFYLKSPSDLKTASQIHVLHPVCTVETSQTICDEVIELA
jgi:hypothetical protein